MGAPTNGVTVKEREALDLNGSSMDALVPENELAAAQPVSNDLPFTEDGSLQKVETAVEARYKGLLGLWRIFEVSRVIVMLSVYLYLDQFDIHRKQQNKQKDERLNR